MRHHLFLDALIAAVLMMTILGLTSSSFIQALSRLRSRLPAHLRRRIDADTVVDCHRNLLGLPHPFHAFILILTLATCWAYFTLIDFPARIHEIVRLEVGPIVVIAEVPGRIRKIHVNEGSQVHRGDVLAQLDTRNLLLKRSMIERRIHAAELRKATAPQQRGHSLPGLYRELEQTRLDLNRLTITSPAEGQIILLGSIHSGEVLVPGTAIALLEPWHAPAASPR